MIPRSSRVTAPLPTTFAYALAKKDGTADRVPTERQKTNEDCDEIMKMMEALK